MRPSDPEWRRRYIPLDVRYQAAADALARVESWNADALAVD